MVLNYNGQNILFKWQFFFKKYFQTLKRGFKGYFIENVDSDGFRHELSVNDKNLAFWFLNLQKEGAVKVVSQKDSIYNIQWDLAVGENNFFELYGKMDEGFLLNGTFPRKTDLFGKDKSELLTFIISFLLEHRYITFDDIFVNIGEDFTKKFLNFKLIDFSYNEDGSVVLKFVSQSGLTQDKILRNMLLFQSKKCLNTFNLAHSYHIDTDNSFKYMVGWSESKQSFESIAHPYDYVYDFINMFKFDSSASAEGKTNFELYEDLILNGSAKGRFKLLPTIVEGLDEAIELQNGLGFANFFKPVDIENRFFQQVMLGLNKFFLPQDLYVSNHNYFFSSQMKQFFNEGIYINIFESSHEMFFYNKNIYLSLPSTPFVHFNWSISHYQNNEKFVGIVNKFHNFNLEQDYLMMLNSCLVFSQQEDSSVFVSKLDADLYVNLYRYFYNLFLMFNNINLFEHVCMLFNSDSVSLTTFRQVLSSYYFYKIQNLLQWKNYVLYELNLTQRSIESFLIKKWADKIKDLFVLNVQIGRNFGAFLEPYVHRSDLDGNEEQTQEDIEEDVISISNYTYKLFVDDVYEPFLTNPGNRPYKWLSMPDLQYSPFLYFFKNFKLFWFYLFGFYPQLSKFTHIVKPDDILISFDDWRVKLANSLVFWRYIVGDDVKYHALLLKLLHSSWYERIFSNLLPNQTEFFIHLDSLLFQGNLASCKLTNLPQIVSSSSVAFKYMPKMMRCFEYYLHHPETWFLTKPKQWSFIYAHDWLLDSEKLTTDQLRLSFLYKLGVSSNHFNFFSFMSPDFFERGVVYQSWMHFRNADRIKDPDNPFLFLDFFRPHTIELTSDITLLKYRLDLLKLISLGFSDVVFEKEDIFVKNFYGYPAERRDIFNMPEYTTPFFFFDSDLDNSSFVPNKPVYERVSSFAIPSLDRPWRIEEYVNVNSENVDYDLLMALNEEMALSEEELQNQDIKDLFVVLKPLWKKDKPAVWFSETELLTMEEKNVKTKPICKYTSILPDILSKDAVLLDIFFSLKTKKNMNFLLKEKKMLFVNTVSLIKENVLYYFFDYLLTKYKERGLVPIASFRNYDSYNLAFGISKNYFMLNFIHFFDMVLCLHDSILYFFFDVFAFKTYEVKNIQEIHSVLAGIGQFMNDFFFFFFFMKIKSDWSDMLIMDWEFFLLKNILFNHRLGKSFCWNYEQYIYIISYMMIYLSLLQ